jgi:hypothetical protein
LIAENLRLFARGKFPADEQLAAKLGAKPDWTGGALALADSIEETLTDSRTGPVPIEGLAANALFGALATITNPAPDTAALREHLRTALSD